MRRMWPQEELNKIAKDAVLNDGWNVAVNYFDHMNEGIVWEGSGGQPAVNDSYIYSDFIRVKPGSTIFTSTDGARINLYESDSFDSYISSTYSSKTTVPANGHYMVYSIIKTDYNKESTVWSDVNWPVNPRHECIISKQPDIPDSVYLEKLTQALQVKNATIILQKFGDTTEWVIDLATPEALNHTWTGFTIGNNVTLKFGSGVKMKAIFDGTDGWIYINFSPFNTWGNFTMENVNIEAQNCRYCVHDELWGAKDRQTHNYINCIMKYTNTVTPATFVQCIGGGLGASTVINIDGGRYESNTTVALDGRTIQQSKQPISYHNGPYGFLSNQIWVKNVYGNGHFEFKWYGTSEHVSPVTVCGCSTEDATILRAEDDSAKIKNLDLIEFNNEVRGVK